MAQAKVVKDKVTGKGKLYVYREVKIGRASCRERV